MFRVKVPDLHEGALPEVPAMFPTFLAAKGHFRNSQLRVLYDFCRRCYILPRRGIVINVSYDQTWEIRFPVT
jgi:hypothetical protein